MAKACQKDRGVHVAKVVRAEKVGLCRINLLKPADGYPHQACVQEHLSAQAQATVLEISPEAKQGPGQSGNSHSNSEGNDERDGE